MDGIVLDIDLQNREGCLRCSEGKRYGFNFAEWRSHESPKKGDRVDFVPLGGQASEIYFLERTIQQPQNTNAAYSANVNQHSMSTQTPIEPQAQQAIASETSKLAIASLICGVIGMFFFGSIVAVICGHMARSKIKHSNGTLTGSGMALAGVILGYSAILFSIVYVIYLMNNPK